MAGENSSPRSIGKEPGKRPDISTRESSAVDLIDFSDREDEFLSSEIKQQALSFALISAVLGFALSSWLFVHQKLGPASVVLDRRAAEGVRAATVVRPEAERGYGAAGFRAPQIEKYQPKPEERPGWTSARSLVAVVDDVDTDDPQVKNSKRVLETSLGVVPDYRLGKNPARRSTRPAKSEPEAAEAAPMDANRLLFPRISERPGIVPMSGVEARVAGNLVILGNGRDEYHPALVLDSRGRALVSSAFARPDFLARIWSNGKLLSGRLLATDNEFGLALIQIESAGQFQDLPLSPVPPSTGDMLMGFALSGRDAAGQSFRAGMPFGKAGYFLDGHIDRYCFGTALFNNRGELSGCYVSALPGAPGSGIHLAVDVTTIYRLLRGYQGGDDDFSVTEGDAVATLRTSLQGSDTAQQIKRGRIIPGAGLSDFFLGMSQEEARKWASPPEVRKFGANYVLWKCPAPPVDLYFAGDTLLAAATSNSGFSTMEGLAVGADVDAGDLRKMPESLVFEDLVSVPGLEILLDPGSKVDRFVVKPRYSN